jgi:hypothetical protein
MESIDSLSWSSESRSVRSRSLGTGLARLQLPDGRADVRTHAVVHVAQDALALVGARLVARGRSSSA